MNTTSEKRLPKEDELLSEITNPSVQRSRRWAITIVGDVPTHTTIGNAEIYFGSIETDSQGILHRHGLVLGAQQKGNERVCLTKLSVLSKLKTIGIKPTYLQSIKNIARYITYMYKTIEGSTDSIPESLKAMMQNAVRTTGQQSYYQNITEEVARQFNEKPSFNAFKKQIIKKQFAYPQQFLKHAYEEMHFGKETKLAKRLKRAEQKLAPRKMTSDEISATIQRIMARVKSATWDGERLERWAVKIILLTAATEARTEIDGIQISPHILVKGPAGTGKTMLGKILFPNHVASQLPTDSEGVGQLTLRQGHNVLKIDDAGQTTLLSKRIVDTIKTCFQNNWSAKEHGCRQDNTATLAWITTNVRDPLLTMSFNGNIAPLKRRFLVIDMDDKPIKFNEQFSMTKQAIDDAIYKQIVITLAEYYEERIRCERQEIYGGYIEGDARSEISKIQNHTTWLENLVGEEVSSESSDEEDITEECQPQTSVPNNPSKEKVIHHLVNVELDNTGETIGQVEINHTGETKHHKTDENNRENQHKKKDIASTKKKITNNNSTTQQFPCTPTSSENSSKDPRKQRNESQQSHTYNTTSTDDSANSNILQQAAEKTLWDDPALWENQTPASNPTDPTNLENFNLDETCQFSLSQLFDSSQ